MVTSTKTIYTNDAYKMDSERTPWNISNTEMNADFLQSATFKPNLFNNSYVNYLPTTNDANSKTPTLKTASVVLSGDNNPILQKSCTPFIISMFLVLVMIIVFIIVRRIKTNTLKLF
jgi:hypothetical protein